MIQSIGYKGDMELEQDGAFVAFESPMPVLSDTDILVKMMAVSVNPIDCKVRKRNQKKLDKPIVLGWDGSGIVEQVGKEVPAFKKGDAIFFSGDITRAGTNRNYHVVDYRLCAHKPECFSFAESAAMPLTSITAWEALFHRMQIDREEQQVSVLIIGGAGGVGSVAIQILKARTDVEVIATASREESTAWCKKMGADEVINHYHLKQAFEQKKLGLPKYVLCCADTSEYFETISEIIAPQGSVCLLTDILNPIDLNVFKLKSVAVFWESMFTRSMYQTPDMYKQGLILQQMAQLIDQGNIQSTLTKKIEPINVKNIIEAHKILESNKMIGKLVLENFDHSL